MGPLLISGLLSGSTFVVAAAETPAPAGPDYSGIALLISAVAALVTAVGGVVLGMRRSNRDELDEALAELVRQAQRDRREQEDP